MSQCSLNFSTIFLQYCPSENVWSIFNRRCRHRTYFALKSKSAEDVAELFVDEILMRHGAPKVLVSDGGKEFTNSIMKAICKLLKIRKITAAPYNPK